MRAAERKSLLVVGGSGQAAHPGDPRLEIDWSGGRQVVGKAGRILILQQLDNRQVILETKRKSFFAQASNAAL